MKKLLLLLFGIVGLSLPSYSLSASDLVGKKCGIIITSTNVQIPNIGIKRCCCDVIQGSSSNEIIIQNFWGYFDVPLTISGNTLSWNLNQSYQGKNELSSYTSIKIKQRELEVATYTSPYGDNYLYYSEAFTVNTNTITSTEGITLPNGDLKFDFYNTDSDDYTHGYILMLDESNRSTWMAVGGFELYFYDADDQAIETDNSTGTSKTYNVDLEYDLANSAFSLNNLFNWGAMNDNDIDTSTGYGSQTRVIPTGTINWSDKTVSIDNCEIGGRIITASVLMSGWTYCYNKYGYEIGTFQSNYWEIEDQNTYKACAYWLASKLNSEDPFELAPVTGRLSVNEAYHNTKVENPKSGLEIETYIKLNMALDNAGVYDSSSSSSDFTTYTVEITPDKYLDISHYAMIDFANMTMSGKTLNCKLRTNVDKAGVNTFVTDESFYIAGGKQLDILTFDLTEGKLLKSQAAAASGSTTDLSLDLSDLPDSEDGWYTIYVVTNYDPWTGLSEKVQQAIAIKEDFIHQGTNNYWAHHVDGGDFHSAFGLRAETYDNSSIIIDQDITHDVALSNAEFGWGKISDDDPNDYIYLCGEIIPSSDIHERVEADHYELYAVAGLYNNVSSSDFSNADLGHKSGACIDNEEYYTSFVPHTYTEAQTFAASEVVEPEIELNEGLKYNLLFPASVVGTTTNEVTLYVKTVYKDNTLAPTYHALTAIDSPTTGVIDQLHEGGEIITVIKGAIVIAGSDGNAAVTTASGTVLYQGGDSTVDVAPGMYIVRAGKTVRKVIVR